MANQIQLVMYEGYMVAAPEFRYTPNGNAVANFRMGSNRSYKKADGTLVRQTTWLKVTVWGSLAEIVNQFCHKGSHVIVTGALRVNETGNPSVYKLNSGDWAASYEITAQEVRILDNKPEGATTDSSVEDYASVGDSDDIPF